MGSPKTSDSVRDRRGAGAPELDALVHDALIHDADALIHERVRLGIVSALAASDRLGFTDLKRLLGVTDGNLSVHARRLELARYVSVTKTFEGRVPRTQYRLTATGRAALQRYLKRMEALIRSFEDSQARTAVPRPGPGGR